MTKNTEYCETLSAVQDFGNWPPLRSPLQSSASGNAFNRCLYFLAYLISLTFNEADGRLPDK